MGYSVKYLVRRPLLYGHVCRTTHNELRVKRVTKWNLNCFNRSPYMKQLASMDNCTWKFPVS